MLDYETTGPRATLTLNDPERRNPLSAEMLTGIYEALETAIADPEVQQFLDEEKLIYTSWKEIMRRFDGQQPRDGMQHMVAER